MSPSQRAFLLLAFLGVAARCAWGAEPPRVAVVVESPNHAAEWQAALTAELSRRADLQIVERAEFSHLLEERARQALTVAPEKPLPAIAGVQFYLHFQHKEPGSWFVEAIDASTGAQLGSVRVKGGTIAEAPAVVTMAGELLSGLTSHAGPSPEKEAARVAVLEGGKEDQRAFILAARLREALRINGYRVLDRALTQPLVVERADAEKGMREQIPEAAFLGADYFVDLVPREGDCEVRLLQARDGRLLASRRFSLADPAVIDALQPWLLPLLGRPAEAVQPYFPTVEIEALEPFYRGLALFDAGQYAEATAEFTRAYLLNDKFGDAMLWEARCYDALGMKPLAEAMRRYAEIGLVGYGFSASARTAPGEAVAFLGVRGEPETLATSLSALAASALANQSDREVRLPQNLSRLRREYDWLAGVSNTAGTRWEQAPSLFCRLVLQGQLQLGPGGAAIDWIMSDSVTGKVVSRREEKLETDPAKWPHQTKNLLKDLFSGDQISTPSRAAAADQKLASISSLEQDLRAHRGPEGNVFLLKLALADPGNRLLGARGFAKGRSKRNGLDAFLDYALRDWLLEQLPPDNPRRRWFELMRISAHFEAEPTGRFVTGRQRNVVEELEKFVAQNPTDPAGLAARYSLLFERQGDMPCEKFGRQCDELLTALQEAGSSVPQVDWLIQMTSELRDLALIAAGDASHDFPDPSYAKMPRRIRAKWHDDGTVELEKLSHWVTNEFSWVPLEPAEKINEARAALAINGRPGEQRKIPDRWLKDYPHSIGVASFAVSALHELNYPPGVPLVHPLDWKAEQASFLAAVNYVDDTLNFWIGRTEDPRKLDQLESTVSKFLMALNERVYLGVYTDQQYEALRDRLAVRIDEANQRLGRQGWPWKRPQLPPWREITRAQIRELSKDHLTETGDDFYDRAVLTGDIDQAARASFSREPCNPVPWWSCLRSVPVAAAFTAPEVAQFYLKHTPEVIKLFETRDPSPKEVGYLFDQAQALFWGGASPEAETLFRRILDAPMEDSSSASNAGALPANAAFRLAQILRLDGRTPEAIEMAQRGLKLCGLTSWFVIGRIYDPRSDRDQDTREETGLLASHLTRLLREMRFDPERAPWQANVGVVTVPTPNVDNPRLKVFFRLPPTSQTNGLPPSPRRVLLLLPSMNHDVLEYLQPENTWARFADAQGLVLVCPQFYSSTRSDRAEHAFTYFINAQVWSGQALLAALDAISQKVPLEKERMLIHAYGAGAGFACRFARWRPDLVSAVSAHGGGAPLPWFRELPDLPPLSALRPVRFLVTGGEDDDFATDKENRFATAVAFVTVLRGAGVDAEWKPFPGVAHVPTPEMEKISQAFLEKQ